MRIVVATSNKGKLSELSSLLSKTEHKLVSQGELGIDPAQETGLTFVENAIQKARWASETAELAAIADDSGLIVPALGGEPGIISARYAGVPGDAQQNNSKLLEALKGMEDRQAYFYCCMVFIRRFSDPDPKIAFGRWEGEITTSPRGGRGFGYDPLFFIPQLDCTAAELPAHKKNIISHRGIAARNLCEQINSN